MWILFNTFPRFVLKNNICRPHPRLLPKAHQRDPDMSFQSWKTSPSAVVTLAEKNVCTEYVDHNCCYFCAVLFATRLNLGELWLVQFCPVVMNVKSFWGVTVPSGEPFVLQGPRKSLHRRLWEPSTPLMHQGQQDDPLSSHRSHREEP